MEFPVVVLPGNVPLNTVVNAPEFPAVCTIVGLPTGRRRRKRSDAHVAELASVAVAVIAALVLNTWLKIAPLFPLV